MELLFAWFTVSVLTWEFMCLWYMVRYRQLEWIDMLLLGVLSVVPVLAWMTLVHTAAVRKEIECDKSLDSW